MVHIDVDGTACRVTLPNGQHPPGGQGLTSRLSYGNGRLWVELYPRGIVRPAYYGRARPNGAIAIKFPWTRGVLAASKSPADDWTRTPLLSDMDSRWRMAAPAFNPRASSSPPPGAGR